MISYVGRRLLFLVPILLGISAAVFFLISLAPGDPALAILGPQASPEQIAVFRRTHGLDAPIVIRYVRWLGDLAHGDLGHSQASAVPVTQLLSLHLTPTALLTGLAICISVPLGVAGGLVSALRRGRVADHATRLLGLVAFSMPAFWLGLLLLLFFGVRLRWLPAGGYVPFADDPLESLRTLILPAITIALPVAAILSRVVRTSLLDTMNEAYVQTARAKGLSKPQIVRRHLLRNAAGPAVTVLGLQIGYLLGGAILAENVFSIPGMGTLLVTAAATRDYAVLQGIALMAGGLVLLTQLAADVVNAWLDPRIRLT